MTQNYIRELEWYQKIGDTSLVGEEDITHITADFLRSELCIGDEDDQDLILGYNAPEEHIHKLQRYIKHRIDTKRYDYQIGCYAKD